jgi:hypothetical protein
VGNDPDRVFVRVVRTTTDTVPERLMLSADAGAHWSVVAERLEIVGFAMSEDGQAAPTGSRPTLVLAALAWTVMSRARRLPLRRATTRMNRLS